MNKAQELFVTNIHIPGMDCPSEEKLIRMALDNIESVRGVEVDLGDREIKVYHSGNPSDFFPALETLQLGANRMESRSISADLLPSFEAPEGEAAALQKLLWINGVMFATELTVGVIAQSTGLIADSLDMLADASVYGLALFVVGKSARYQLNAAHLSGVLQFALAIGVLIEVARRLILGSEPVSLLMMSFGSIALIANVACLMIIHRHRDGGAHMKASWIFSANDVIANVGVILAGVLVYFTGSNYPDLIIGLLIVIVVLSGAIRILRLKG